VTTTALVTHDTLSLTRPPATRVVNRLLRGVIDALRRASRGRGVGWGVCTSISGRRTRGVSWKQGSPCRCPPTRDPVCLRGKLGMRGGTVRPTLRTVRSGLGTSATGTRMPRRGRGRHVHVSGELARAPTDHVRLAYANGRDLRVAPPLKGWKHASAHRMAIERQCARGL